MRAARFAILLALGVLGAGCENLTGPGEGVYRGHYTRAFEANGFVACGSDEGWWVEFASTEVSNDLNARVPGPTGLEHAVTAYVVWRGTPSRKGSYGHLGASEREFRVEEVIEARLAGSDDCS